MRKYLISVFLIFGFYTDLVPASENCKIPMNKQYSLATFRPQYSSKPSQYQPNELVSHSTHIIIACKKDIYHDAIREVSKSQCLNGTWTPELPNCEVKRRCKAPEIVAHATSSRTLDEYITFPDGGYVKFTCHDGYSSHGNAKTTCNDGVWTPIDFKCHEIRVSGRQNSPIDQNLPPKNLTVGAINDQDIAKEPNLCDNIIVPHGNVDKIVNEMYTYRVVCETGKRLNGNHKSFKCYAGKWIGARPACITKGTKKHKGRCIYPSRIRKLSNMRSRDTGESINTYYIQDGVKVTQTCINDSEVLRTECHNGQWLPTLMNCRQQRRNGVMYRIRAPGSQNSVIDQRKAKETLSVDENLTTKEHLTGIDKPVVVNPPVKEGDTSMDHFNRPSDNAIANDPGVAEETNLCDNIKVPHGNVVKVDGDIYRYRVVCETGKRLNGNKEAFKCYEGNWIGARPACITKGTKKHRGRCRYPYRIRKLSNIRSRDTGKSIITYYIQDGVKVTQTCINDGEVLQTECHNGQWLPSLMNCRQQRPRNRAMYRSAILRTCTIPKSEENVTYSSTHTSGTGDSESYFGGDVIKSGIKIERRCLADTTDGAPGTLTVVNLLCADGSWMPSIKPCQISISQYRVRVRPSSNSDKLPTNIVITGSGNRRTNIKLQNYTVDPHDVREYDVTAPDVGKIRKITYQTSNPSHQISVDFTSIYKPSVDEYYVSHQKDIHATKNNKRVCSSKFTEPIKWQPDWSKRPDYKDLQDLTDAVSCNMACVEETSFTCKASFYDTDQRCYLFKEWEIDNLESNPDALTNLYIRLGTCA